MVFLLQHADLSLFLLQYDYVIMTLYGTILKNSVVVHLSLYALSHESFLKLFFEVNFDPGC